MSKLFARSTSALGAAWIISLASFALLAPAAAAAVFPDPSIAENSRTPRAFGKKRALYYVVHDDNDLFTPAEWNTRVSSIRTKELSTRDFFAENSGGAFDIYYDPVIVDAPIPLNPDGTRPANWLALANNIATASYGLDLNDYFMLAYDVDDTTSDPNQGWGGLSTSNRIYLQSTVQRTINHEIGHQVGADHAQAIRQLANADFHPYYWDAATSTYRDYIPGTSPFTAVPFGAAVYQYGHPLDTMGSGSGHFRIREKIEDLGWIDDAQVPDLNDLGPGTYKIYAHDQLQSVTDAQGNYGVTTGYNPDVFYGLTYERPAQEFSASLGKFLPTTQTIDLEFRGGTSGIGFYIDGHLVDLDPAGGQTSSSALRLLKVGQSIEDPAFGMSTFHIFAGSINQVPTGEDFLDYNPPPPSLLTADWFRFSVLSTGNDAIGSFIQVAVSSVSPLNGIDGDLDQNGIVNLLDVGHFVDGWLANTSVLQPHAKYLSGDMNFDGTTDLSDAYLFHNAWLAAGGSALNLQAMLQSRIPEPSTAPLLAAGLAVAALRRRGSKAESRKGKGDANSVPSPSLSRFPFRLSKLTLSIACGLAATLTAPHAQAKLISHYTFDANTRTGQVYSNLVTTGPKATGQSSSSVFPANIADGVLGQAVRFDGATNYLNTTTSGHPNRVTGLRAGSVAFWIRSDSLQEQQAVMGVINSGTNTAFSIDFGEAAADDLRVFIRAQGGAVSGPDTNGPLNGWNDGEWHHIAVTWDLLLAEGNAIYFDGKSVNVTQKVSGATAYNSYSYPMMIGAMNSRGTPTRHLEGDLDDFRVYDHVLDVETVLGLTGNPVPTLNIDRATGELTLVNTTNGPLALLGYSIQSPSNSLNQSAWTAIADHYDADPAGPAQIDADDAWIKLADPQSRSDLSEANLAGSGPGDGATLAVGAAISLGVGAWTPSAIEDLKMTILRGDGTNLPVIEQYAGVLSNADFDANGIVDGDDFLTWQRGAGIATQATRAQGDANSDGAVNELDLNVWKQQFGNTTPAIAAAVPEPAAAWLLLVACLACGPGLRNTFNRQRS